MDVFGLNRQVSASVCSFCSCMLFSAPAPTQSHRAPSERDPKWRSASPFFTMKIAADRDWLWVIYLISIVSEHGRSHFHTGSHRSIKECPMYHPDPWIARARCNAMEPNVDPRSCKLLTHTLWPFLWSKAERLCHTQRSFHAQACEERLGTRQRSKNAQKQKKEGAAKAYKPFFFKLS